jgi:hypothetical protein
MAGALGHAILRRPVIIAAIGVQQRRGAYEENGERREQGDHEPDGWRLDAHAE